MNKGIGKNMDPTKTFNIVCEGCKGSYDYPIPHLCQTCAGYFIEENINEIQTKLQGHMKELEHEIDRRNKKTKGWMDKLKWFSIWMVLVGVPTIIVSILWGWKFQFIALVVFIYGNAYNLIEDYIYEKIYE